MRISEIYNQGFALSFEVFPPKTQQGMPALYQAVEALSRYNPGFISCTYGAGGSTRDRTLEIVTEIQRRFGITTTAHFTCVGSSLDELRGWLAEAKKQGVQNIMALRGDPPKGEASFKPVPGGLSHANELVAVIRKEFPQFGIGVAGYPEAHQEAVSFETDLQNLKRKVDAGADAIFTQLFYDNADFYRFRDRCQQMGIKQPIIPGLLPVLTLPQVQRITTLCKAKLPEQLSRRLENSGEDPAAQTAVGVDFCAEQCDDLLRQGVPGIHFYVLNRSDSASQVLDRVRGLVPTR